MMKDFQTVKTKITNYGVDFIDWSEMSAPAIRRSLISSFKFLKDEEGVSKEDLLAYVNHPDAPLGEDQKDCYLDALNNWNGLGWEE